MEGKSVNFNTHCVSICRNAHRDLRTNRQKKNLYEPQLQAIARWLSCNGEVWGVGPTAVFASAAALFLFHELEETFEVGDHASINMLEKSLISTMMLGMLALMIHIWVCSMRFFQYYLDTLIKDSPSMLLEMTTATFLGGHCDLVPLGPLTKFVRTQQPQIHITVCWFLALCYADYVRKHYCRRFNLPYLEQWQDQLQERASRSVHTTMEHLNTFLGNIHQRLRGYTTQQAPIPIAPVGSRSSSQAPPHPSMHTESALPKARDISFTSSKLSCGSCRLHRAGSVAGPAPVPGTAAAAVAQELAVHFVGQEADSIEKLRAYIQLYEWSKCGDNAWSTLPTVLWAIGSAALAHRLLSALFRRFLFRRVPLWEVIMQDLLFLWLVMHSLNFWVALVQVLKVVIEFCYEDTTFLLTEEDVQGKQLMKQWIIWMFGLTPLATYLYTRPRVERPPLMIWITTNPWQRREMGPYGYYLNRPFSEQPTVADLPPRQMCLRKAFSDSKLVIKEPTKRKKLYSKSI